MSKMNTIVAVPLDSELAEYIGKKGDVNSITFYSRNTNGNVIVAIVPSSIEEKFYALPETLLIADQIVVSTKNPDKNLGEILIACSLLGKRTIFTKDNDISKFTANLKFENSVFFEHEEIIDALLKFEHKDLGQQPARVDIDKAFNVKGIGTVILGIVSQGVVKVHDNLFHNGGKTAMIRSMQSHDIDIQEAAAGTRVGLAIKGIDDSEIEKGDVFQSTQVKNTKEAVIEIKKSDFAKENIEIGKLYSIASGFCYSNATALESNGNVIKFKLERTMPLQKNDKVIVCRPQLPRMFAVGVVTTTSSA